MVCSLLFGEACSRVPCERCNRCWYCSHLLRRWKTIFKYFQNKRNIYYLEPCHSFCLPFFIQYLICVAKRQLFFYSWYLSSHSFLVIRSMNIDIFIIQASCFGVLVFWFFEFWVLFLRFRPTLENWILGKTHNDDIFCQMAFYQEK